MQRNPPPYLPADWLDGPPPRPRRVLLVWVASGLAAWCVPLAIVAVAGGWL